MGALGRREAAVKLGPPAATIRSPAFTVLPPSETFCTVGWLPERDGRSERTQCGPFPHGPSPPLEATRSRGSARTRSGADPPLLAFLPPARWPGQVLHDLRVGHPGHGRKHIGKDTFDAWDSCQLEKPCPRRERSGGWRAGEPAPVPAWQGYTQEPEPVRYRLLVACWPEGSCSDTRRSRRI